MLALRVNSGTDNYGSAMDRALNALLPRSCQQKRRCYQRRSGAPTRGTGPLRLALAGATRSGSAGVGSPWLAIR